MTQIDILNGLKPKIFLGELVSILPAIGKYWILKLHDSTQDHFSPSPSIECLQIPLNDDIHTVPLKGNVALARNFSWSKMTTR